jgi:hypothetical protein
MATPRNRQYNPGGSSGGGGGGLGAILAALVGAPGVTGGEDVTNTIDPEVDLGTSGAPVRAPYAVQKPTLGQKVFNPRGVQASQGMADMLKFEDYQNQLRSGLVGQHNQGQLELEKLRSSGDIAEKQEAERIKKDEFARSIGLPSWEHAKAILSDPDVQTSVLKKIYADNEKQGVENDLNRSKGREADATALSKEFISLPENGSAYNARTGLTITSRGPLQYEPAPGYAGGVGASRLPVSNGGSGSGRFVQTPGGVASELTQRGDSFQPPDVSEIGGIFQPYTPQGSGTNPTVNGPIPAPRTSPLGNKVKEFLSNNLAPGFENFLNNFRDSSAGSAAGNAIAPQPTSQPSSFNTQQFQQDFTDPFKGILNSIIGQSPTVPADPNAYENYTGQQPVTPSLRPVVQPPSILEEMRKRRQRLFPQPIQSYPFGR